MHMQTKILSFEVPAKEANDYLIGKSAEMGRRKYRRGFDFLKKLNDDFMAEDYRITPHDDLVLWTVVRKVSCLSLKRGDTVIEDDWGDYYGVFVHELKVDIGVIQAMWDSSKSKKTAYCDVRVPYDFLNDDILLEYEKEKEEMSKRREGMKKAWGLPEKPHNMPDLSPVQLSPSFQGWKRFYELPEGS